MSNPSPPDDGGDERGRSRANLAVLIAIIVLALLGYWAFRAIEKQRELQNCLDEGRRNCLEIVHPER